MVFNRFLFVFSIRRVRRRNTEKNKKRDIPDWYQSGSDRYGDSINDKSREILRRGDIPILHGDCDGNEYYQNLIAHPTDHSIVSLSLPLFLFFPMSYEITDALTKAVQDLIVLVKQLREDVAHQTAEINHLRRLIENCAGCREPVQINRENCQNANPCFEGVQCYDAESGPRCGRCPSGETYIHKFGSRESIIGILIG